MKRKLLLAVFAALVGLFAKAQTWTGNPVEAGTFYLYNVGADKFLNNGDPAQSWGTNAYLQAGFGLDVVLAKISDGVYTIDTNVSNGGNSHYLANSTWCDGGATNWTFRAVDGETNVYQIIFDGQYLMATEALNDIEMVGDPGSRTTSTYWKLVSENDFKAAMVAKEYSAENPMDVSVFIKGRSFARNDGRNSSWTSSHNGGNWTWIGASDNKYYGNEAWNNTFDVHQAITGLPEGTYEVRCSGFGTNGTTYVYGNSTKGLLQTDNTTSYGTNKEAKWKAIHEDNAFAGQSSGTFAVGDGNLTVGIKRETNNGGDWCVWDEFRLYYYGLDLSEFETALANAVSAAEAVEGTVPTTAYNTLAAVVAEQNKTYTSASAYQTATNAIVEATNTAKALQKSYARFVSVRTGVLSVNSGIDVSAANTAAEAATTNEAINEAVTTLRGALSSYLASAGITNDQIDLTAALIDNPSPGTAGNLDYWTNSGTPSLQAQLYEYWNVSAGTTKQTIATELPVGYYTLTAIAYTRDNMTATLHAGEHTLNLVGCGAVNDRNGGSNWIAQGGGVNELTFHLATATANLEIGLTADKSTGDHWMCWRSFKLEYLGTAPLVLFQKQLADAATAAESHATALNGTIPAAASTAYINAINTAKAANTTIDDCLQGVSDIEAATAAADALVEPYAAYQLTVSDATFVGIASETISAQNTAVAEATTVDGITACTTALTTAIDAVECHDITTYTIKNPTAQTKDNWEGTDFGTQSDNVCEYWGKSGADFHQTINLPAGKYCLTVVALQRTNMNGVVYANADANTNSRTIVQVPSSSISSRSAASAWFNAGNGKNKVYFELADAADVVIGLTCDNTTGDHWTVWQSFKLDTYDETVAASYLKPGYDEAMAAAVAYQTVDMFDADKNALNQAISDNTVNPATATISGYETAIANLNAAAAAAATAAANYTQYNAVVSVIGGNTNVDLTSFVTNGDFQLNNLDGWTSVDGGNVANNGNFNSTYFVERWKNGVALGSGSLTHDAIVLPAGVYCITADAQNIEQYHSNAAGTGLFLCANEEQTEIGAKGNYAVFVKVADKTPLTIKFLQNNCSGNWIAYDNVTLTYVAADYVYAAVDGKMNADVAAAQTAAVEAFEAAQNGANYQAMMEAIAAAQASKDAYAAAGQAIADAKALKDAHNFATATAITTFAEAIAAVETPYEANTLSNVDAAAAGTTLGTVVTGWHAGTNGAAVKYMNDGFSLNDFEANLYVNTWSNEGESDGSNFKVPFYEYFAGEGSKLPEKTWTGTLTGLENGLYSVSVWVRPRSINAETDAADVYGITMDVNGGTAIDVTEGDVVPVQEGNARFQHKVYTAEGLVKDGTLNLNINVASDNNIHWLSFKNIKYTKVRDLNPEEMAVAPTAIALYVDEEEVSEVALNKDNMTVTLTPSYTPADATPGYISWESSDPTVATVADGVVTAVLPGTATITATSTIDPSISASATVIVTFPESTVPATYYVNDGSTRTVYTLGENLIKNGSFEYVNPYYGWTYGTGSTTAITSEKFDIITEGAADGNQYLKAKTNEGGAAAGSLNTSWQIEPNKTYVFGYKVKANDASTGNQYLGTSLNTKKGQENTNAKMANPAYSANEWTDVNYIFESGENTWLVFNARWLASNISFDNFYLAEATYKLEGNVDYATAAIPTANIGTGAFQYSQDAIDAANALVQGEATVADVEAAYAAVTTVNEPAEGQLFNVILTYGGWTYDQKAMTYLAGDRKDMGNYNIKYQAAANQNLAQAFTFTKVSGNNYKMSQIDADGNARYISTGVPYSGGNTSQIRTTTDANKALVVTVIPTSTEGKWNLKNTEADNYIGSQDAGVYTVNSHIDFNIVETSKPSITINTTAAGWGTVMLPFAQALPEGVKAYSVEFLDGDKLMLEDVDALDANKPYIIEGAWNEIVTGDAQGTALKYTDGLLTGVYESQEATEGTYILQKQDEVVGFFLVDYTDWAYENKPQVKANRAYLTTPGGAGVKAFILGGNDETAIKSVFDGVANGDIYDLGGRKVQRMQKGGVYVVNGKKVIVK